MKTSLLLIAFFTINQIVAQSKNIVIVGGGMTGLSAAYHILEQDSTASITIFEKEAKLGGNARTVSVPNSKGELVFIDAGPQYFTQGPWDEYIEFLKKNGVYDASKIESMVGSISIQHVNNDSKLITPLNGDYRDEKLNKLLRFRRFNIEANKVYKHPEKWNGQTISTWVNSLPFEPDFQDEIIYPFLAASLGTTIAEIKTTAVSEIVKLFAFRKPKQKDTFSIFEVGMGELIERMGQQLEPQLSILRNAEVLSISSVKQSIEYKQNGLIKQHPYDFIIFAAHPDQTAKILNHDSQFQSLATELNQLKYFEARIVIHSDTTYASPTRPAFLNVRTDSSNEVVTNTMNLGMISDRLDGIYKSWMSDEEKQHVIERGAFLMEEIFYHPLITPEFISIIQTVNKEVEPFENISIVGAWSEGLETQNSAVQSGKRAALDYLEWLKLNQTH